jgi:hypothetical protein
MRGIPVKFENEINSIIYLILSVLYYAYI